MDSCKTSHFLKFSIWYDNACWVYDSMNVSFRWHHLLYFTVGILYSLHYFIYSGIYNFFYMSNLCRARTDSTLSFKNIKFSSTTHATSTSNLFNPSICSFLLLLTWTFISLNCYIVTRPRLLSFVCVVSISKLRISLGSSRLCPVPD